MDDEINRIKAVDSISHASFDKKYDRQTKEKDYSRDFYDDLSEFSSEAGKKAFDDFNKQAALFYFNSLEKDELSRIKHDNVPLSDFSLEQAVDLLHDDSYFGVDQTSLRISRFVLENSGNNKNMIITGKKGITQGFREAEKIWGGSLPEICYETYDTAMNKIENK
ncbi:MAG: hydrogenase-4 component G [Thermodesulfobacteriota bacterium]